MTEPVDDYESVLEAALATGTFDWIDISEFSGGVKKAGSKILS